MTTTQFVRLLKAKRTGKGKWVAKCVVHHEKTASLSIREGKRSTLLHCFGCLAGGKQVCNALGLRISDLYYDSKPDLKAIREAEQVRAAEGRQRQKQKAKIRRALASLDYWRQRKEELGIMLAESPDSGKLASLFHSALTRVRTLDQTAVDLMCQLHHFKPDYFSVGD
jgi:hypothetical protein